MKYLRFDVKCMICWPGEGIMYLLHSVPVQVVENAHVFRKYLNKMLKTKKAISLRLNNQQNMAKKFGDLASRSEFSFFLY